MISAICRRGGAARERPRQMAPTEIIRFTGKCGPPAADDGRPAAGGWTATPTGTRRELSSANYTWISEVGVVHPTRIASQPSSCEARLIKSERKKTLSIIDHAATLQEIRRPKRSVRIVKRAIRGCHAAIAEIAVKAGPSSRIILNKFYE
ncbi:hypothetical protein EVAR_89783_1 [Eumeta japonica]|uniref:Uncharacterized protein n=1 Tax=Eumeta variegata TaxID=151549 RepID=A0A4C1XFX7_EUMVA|nr:hypothetical protein EVAR_89783_1 [Eumeta japonica]